MFLGFLVWTHTNKRGIGSPSNTQTMKTENPHSEDFGRNNILIANVRSAITILRNSVNVGNPLSDSQRELIYSMAVDELAPLQWYGRGQ
jgi:hypothetical protein